MVIAREIISFGIHMFSIFALFYLWWSCGMAFRERKRQKKNLAEETFGLTYFGKCYWIITVSRTLCCGYGSWEFCFFLAFSRTLFLQFAAEAGELPSLYLTFPADIHISQKEFPHQQWYFWSLSYSQVNKATSWLPKPCQGWCFGPILPVRRRKYSAGFEHNNWTPAGCSNVRHLEMPSFLLSHLLNYDGLNMS